MTELAALEEDALALLRELLRIDTSNPPGGERPAAELCAEKLREAGLEPALLEKAPRRTNLVCRLRGTGARPPLMLTAHLDVVPAGEGWTHPPFAGEEHGGYLWGRGAIDMKHHAAMSVAVMRHLATGPRLARDLLLVLTADEEAGCELGSVFLVNEHADLVRAEYALGEIGGFTLHLGDRRLYPVQIAQKGALWLRATTRGPAGHGSLPREDTAVAKLARALERVSRTMLPFHPPAATRAFLETAAATQPAARRVALRTLLDPRLGPALLRRLPDRSLARSLHAVLANTVTPTIVRAGEKINVIPDRAEAELDARTLPGPDGARLLEELRAVVGSEVELTVLRELPAVESNPGTPLFAALAAALRRADPEGLPVPYLVPGFTDALAFTRNGAIYHGFAPVGLPDPTLKFAELYHAPDERIPVAGLRFGVRVLLDAVQELCA